MKIPFLPAYIWWRCRGYNIRPSSRTDRRPLMCRWRPSGWDSSSYPRSPAGRCRFRHSSAPPARDGWWRRAAMTAATFLNKQKLDSQFPGREYHSNCEGKDKRGKKRFWNTARRGNVEFVSSQWLIDQLIDWAKRTVSRTFSWKPTRRKRGKFLMNSAHSQGTDATNLSSLPAAFRRNAERGRGFSSTKSIKTTENFFKAWRTGNQKGRSPRHSQFSTFSVVFPTVLKVPFHQ